MRFNLLLALSSVFLLPSFSFAKSGYAEQADNLPVARNGEVIESLGSGAIEPVLSKVKQAGAVDYLSAGVGEEDKEALKGQDEKFNLRMLIKSKKGEYMSSLSIKFFNSKNEEVVAVENVGPYLYINLPEGAYTAEVKTMTGIEKKAKVKANKKAKGLVYITIG